jgi:N-acetyl-gamma-glutamylphosphate reductase
MSKTAVDVTENEIREALKDACYCAVELSRIVQQLGNGTRILAEPGCHIVAAKSSLMFSMFPLVDAMHEALSACDADTGISEEMFRKIGRVREIAERLKRE